MKALEIDFVQPAEETDTKAPTGKKKEYAISASKGLGVLMSIAITAYVSVQEAISDRPTKADVKESVTEIKATHKEHKLLKHRETDARIKALDDEIDAVEDALIGLSGKVDALDEKLSTGLNTITEELRYLNRKE